MIRQCNDSDFETIYSIINDAAKAYRGVIPEDRWKEPYIVMRKRIESTFGGISNFLPKKIRAVMEYGFLLNVVLFISGYAILRTVI